jgi:putative ABC transport system permease protein
MQTFLKDIRYGVRGLLKHPGFTAIAIVTLALGIGANTAIFSVVNAVLLRPLPYPQPDQPVLLRETTLRKGTLESVTAGNYLDWRAQGHSFDSMAAFRYESFSVTGTDRPERVAGVIANSNLFSLLQVPPMLGRTFLPEDEKAGDARVAVIGYGVWVRRFASDPAVTNRKLTINGKDLAVVGVMPPGFDFPGEAELWVPARSAVPEHLLKPTADMTQDRGAGYLDVIARLRTGTGIEQAQADLNTVAERLAQQYPDSNQGRGVKVLSLREQVVGDVRQTLLILFGAVGFVLLIAGSNVANLLLARAATRQKEIAIRRALGASRLRLVRQLLTESVLLTFVGGSIGLLVAQWAMRPLLALVPAGVHGLTDTRIDTNVLLFTLGLSLLTGLFFGLLPALQASKTSLNENLKESARGSGGAPSRNRARSFLIVSEVSLSLVLLVGAGLMIKSFFRVQQVNPGFQTAAIQTVRLTLPPAKYPEKSQQAEFFRQVLEDLKVTPGVAQVALISRLPLTPGNSNRSLEIEGRPSAAPGEAPIADYRTISQNYFRAMGIPLLCGRDFTDRDDATAPATVIINEQLAQRVFPGVEPIGKRLRIEGDDSWMEVVGVTGNVRHFGLDAESHAEMYVSYRKFPWPFMSIVTRGQTGVDLSNAIRSSVWRIDRDEPIPEIVTMDLLISRSLANRRLNMLLLGIFGGVALVLAAIGIYGVISHSVSQRTHEIGLRMALGARTSDVIKLVLKNGMTPALVGVGAGLLGAFGLTRLLRSLLFGVTPTDFVTFASVAVALLAVALFACYIPARRATKVDPLVALRYE